VGALADRELLASLQALKGRIYVPTGAIAGIDRHDRADFPVDDQTYAALHGEFDAWIESLAASLEVSGPGRGLEPEVEPPGLDLEL